MRVLLVALVLAPMLAAADDLPPGLTPPTAMSADHRSYRGEVLLYDGISDALIVGGLSGAGGGFPVMLGLGGYLVAGPDVHLRHGHTGRAIASLALRIALPSLGWYVGSQSGGDDPEIAAGLLALGGMVIAQAVDIGVLARDDDPPPPRSIAPSIMPARGGATVGVSGSF